MRSPSEGKTADQSRLNGLSLKFPRNFGSMVKYNRGGYPRSALFGPSRLPFFSARDNTFS